MRSTFFLVPALVLALAGCAAPPFERPRAPGAAAGTAGASGAADAQVRPQARPEAAGAAQAPQPGSPPPGPLGTTIASLGDPTQPGLWLKTPLVSRERPGRLSLGDASVEVTLIPLDGPATAGSRMSPGAFRALGAALTDLPEVTVFAG